MKVAFLIHSLESPSCRYRVLQYLPYWKKQGIDASIHFYRRRWLDKLRFYNTLGQYDIFYIHRKLFSPPEFFYIRKRAKKIIYDFDDALMYRSSNARSPYSLSRRVKFACMMKGVNFVIAGNQFLRSEVFRYHDHVEVIPTSIDLSRYTVKKDPHDEGLLTIGWLGSASTLAYLESLIPVFEVIFEKCQNFQVKIVCDRFLESSRVPVVKKRWSAGEEQADLKSFDIGVMPLADDLWSRGKCGLKILQYFGVGVPAVCTPVGANREIVQDGVNGFWAQNREEWQDRLVRLIQDEGLRKRMGVEGRKTVERAYSLEASAPRLYYILRQVAGEEPCRD